MSSGYGDEMVYGDDELEEIGDNQQESDDQTDDGKGSQGAIEDAGEDAQKGGFGEVGKAPPARESEKSRWWPSCVHARWTKLDRKRFKDRIVVLEKCRRCGKKRADVTYMDLGSRNVYVATDHFAVPPASEDVR